MARHLLAGLASVLACAPLPAEQPARPSIAATAPKPPASSTKPAEPCHRVAHPPCFDDVAKACAAANCPGECGLVGGWNAQPVAGCGADVSTQRSELPPNTCVMLADSTCHPTIAEACVAAACPDTFHDECHDDGKQIVACTSNW